MTSINNQRIAKNTLIMYARMIIFLGISLFTARIVFNTLGVDNYGIYNLVAGVIVFFTFLNNGLSTATKRFITTEIGKNTAVKTRHVFNICMHAHIIIALIVVLLAETIGLWVVNSVLNIPIGRLYAANFVYQISIITAVFEIIKSLYMSIVVANEQMGIYAYLTIIDITLKLLVIYLVQAVMGDKLIVYAWLILGVSFFDFILCLVYCYRVYPICKWEKVQDVSLLKDVFSFMSWSLLGQLAVVGTNQGVSVLINIYYTVAVNAAMGISNSVTNIAANFVSNFQIAFNPQIIKLYNNKDFSRLETLVFRSSKISSYLIMVFIIPIFFEIKNILYFWLGEYPKYSVEFILFTLLAIYFDSISAPLWMIIYSQTNIRRYQIVISSVYSLNFFLGWLFLLMGAYPYSVIGVRIVVFVFLLLVRLSYVKMIFPLFNTRKWLKDVLLKSICISLLSVAIVFVVYSTLDCMPFYHMVLIVIISVLTTVSLIYLLGFDNEERLYIKQYLLNLLRR